jgi:hypothetical protein
MKDVQKKVAGDIFIAIIQQVKKQVFEIHANQPEVLEDSSLDKDDIFQK